MNEKFTYLNDDLRYQVISVGRGTLVRLEKKDSLADSFATRRVIFISVDDLKAILNDIEEEV